MLIVDAQVHVWAAPSAERPWRTGPVAAHRPEPVGVEEILRVLDADGVRHAVLVPPSWEGDRNDLAWQAAAQHPDRFAVMGRIPPDPRSARRLLAGWRDRPGSLGLRVTLHAEPERSAFLRGQLDWLWTAASAADLPVMVYPPGLCRQLAEVAARHPDLRLVVDHLALPVGTTAPAAFADLPDLLALADRPNVAVKASALPCHSAMPYPFADLHAPILAVLDAFGPQRVFWGSDWTRLPCAYRDNVTLFTAELDAISGDDLRSVMGEGLLRWLGWPVPGNEPCA